MILRVGSCCHMARPCLRAFRRFGTDTEGTALMHATEGAEGFWERRVVKVRRKRFKMLQQVGAAHDQLHVFYELARQRLVQQGKLSEEDAAKFARIDGRLASLQRDPLQLEFYDRRKQFHEDYVRKRFALGKEEEEE
mmetsp:Transcript_58073/g.136100  ORF Transcript_58073/g.136100 Transcript_58073/m.136100 type:complete len:137 (+) Transcript_58073:55-465(+)